MLEEAIKQIFWKDRDELIQGVPNGEVFLLEETWMVMLEKIVVILKEWVRRCYFWLCNGIRSDIGEYLVQEDSHLIPLKVGQTLAK